MSHEAGLAVLAAVAFIAGVQNALAGGGSFITLPALLLFGMNAQAANITSTIALFPGQVTTGLANRRHVAGATGVSFRTLALISLAGGAVGAFLLLATPADFFEKLVPFLVLFATAVFAWGSFGGARHGGLHISPRTAMLAQSVIAIYGGYFGGGIGMLMLAALTLAGQAVHTAGSTKNVLAGVMNASAVVVFAFSPQVHWVAALAVGFGARVGGQAGAWLMFKVPGPVLRIGVVAIGVLLTLGLFWRSYASGPG
jgi:uncharacterized membrane protein YfcA